MAEIFPTEVGSGELIDYPLEIKTERKTYITTFETGAEQRRQVWAFPKRTIKIGYSAANPNLIKNVWQLYETVKGSKDWFWFYVPEPRYWYNEQVGTGTGSSAVYDLPVKNSSATLIQIYSNGSPISHTHSTAGGQAGAETVSVNAPLNETVTADFFGKCRMKMRFDNDSLDQGIIFRLVWNTALELKEVR